MASEVSVKVVENGDIVIRIKNPKPVPSSTGKMMLLGVLNWRDAMNCKWKGKNLTGNILIGYKKNGDE